MHSMATGDDRFVSGIAFLNKPKIARCDHVGAVKRFSGVKWTVVERISWAWLLTLPATGVIGYILARIGQN